VTTLHISDEGELRLTLRGAAENRILTSVRRWPHWRGVDIERDPVSAELCLSVTLITDQIYESTVREILKRSFGMTFPTGGGMSELAPEPPSRSKRRGR
jgi:hypothetical protein